MTIQISAHGIDFLSVLDYMPIFKDTLHTFWFCIIELMVVLKDQKHMQGFLVLSENINPGGLKKVV